MTSVHDIPIEDIKLFLRGNNILVPDTDRLAYREARNLMKSTKLLFYPPSIVEWITAHNLIVSKVKIPNYTEQGVLNLPQNELNLLAKSLTMRTNDRYNVIKILYYMNKLISL